METLSINNGTHGKDTMRAVIWEGKVHHIAVRSVPRPKILAKEDAIVRITSSAICGSDMHTYRGIFGSSNPPWGLGHEAIGIVAEVGSAVGALKVGDRVIVPDSPDDGKLNIEPIQGFEAFGFGPDFGNLDGAQGEWPVQPVKWDRMRTNPFLSRVPTCPSGGSKSHSDTLLSFQ